MWTVGLEIEVDSNCDFHHHHCSLGGDVMGDGGMGKCLVKHTSTL